MLRPTIYALSTPPGKSAIGIVRISGPQSIQIARELTRSNKQLNSHVAYLRSLYGQNGLLDQAVLIHFDKNRSYTGEHLVELHCHGSVPVLRAVMDAISGFGARHAEPGEFTRRAFYNNKLDLTQVEGIRDLLDAETELQRQLAVSQASGALHDLYTRWRSELLNNVAMLTAIIDFADDNEIETTPNALIGKVLQKMEALEENVRAHYARIQRSEIVRQGIRLTILGPPNAGKSSLINRLVRRTASIVSDIPGTTRDVVTVNLDIKGHKVVLGDTAGIREIESQAAHDQIEAIGVQRALEEIRDSDVLLVVVPLNDPKLSDILTTALAEAKAAGTKILTIGNKADLCPNASANVDVSISCKTGDGIEDLIDKLGETADAMTDLKSQNMIGASTRTRELLETQVLPGLQAAIGFLKQGDVILGSAELQLAADGIAKITGRHIGVNEVLDVVFGTFCIGK